MKRFLGLMLVVWGCCISLVFAQEVTVTARADRTTIGQDDRFVYDIIISGKVDNSMQLHLPAFEGNFQIVSQGQENSYSIINGQVSSSQTRHFELVPLRVGDLTIPPAKLVGGGTTYQSQALVIHVKKGAAPAGQPAQGGNAAGVGPNDVVILRGTVSKTEAYEGEEIIYQLEFLRRVQLWSSISYQFPEFKGFWAETLKANPNETTLQINGKGYGVRELARRSLFPLHPGTATISSSKAGFVLNPFEGDRVVESKPITIKVKPLPLAGKPANFSGLVGDFSLAGNALPKVASQNQPITLRIELKGRGGLTRVSDLVFAEDPAFKVYKSKVQDAIQFENGVSGKRVFDYILVPRTAGQFKTPGFSVSFFHPKEGKYKTVTVPGTALTIVPSSEEAEVSDFQSGAQPSQLREEIRYVHRDLDTGKSQGVKQALAWVLGLANAGLLLGLATLLVVRRFVFKTEGDVQHSFAYRHALKRVAGLQKKGGAAFYQELESILIGYLSARTRMELNGLTWDKLQGVLVEKQVPDAMIQRIGQFLEHVHAGGYAPGAATKGIDDYASELKQLLADLKGTV